mgnify:CR=1 FL=1
MNHGSSSFLRVVAAILACLSGTAQVAALWLRELTPIALGDALLGSVYLILGIGLFGRSRFSLFMAVVICGSVSGTLLYLQPQPEQVYTLRIAVDLIIALFSASALWLVRNEPSV